MWGGGFGHVDMASVLVGSLGPVCGSIRGGYEQEMPWGKSTDSLSELVKGFLSIYPNILEMAKKPNSHTSVV